MRDATEHLDEAFMTSRFRLRDSISSGFNLWKKGMGSYVGITFIILVIAMILGFIPIIGQVANTLLIGPAFTLGIYLYSRRIEEDDDAEFSMMLDGFKYSVPIIIAKVITTAIVLLLSMLLFKHVFGGYWLDVLQGDIEFLTASILENDMEVIEDFRFDGMAFLYAIPLMIFSILVYFTECFIGFYNLGPIQAINNSIRFIFKNFFKFFIFLFIVGLIAASGIIILLVGILFTMSMLYPILYRAFASMTDLDSYLESEERMPDLSDDLIV